MRRCSCAYLGAALAAAGLSIAGVWSLRLEVLYHDGWRIEHDFLTRPLLAALWQHQSGHRSFFPLLFHPLDRWLCAGTGALLVALCFALRLGIVALVWRRVFRGGAGGDPLAGFGLGLAVFGLFWMGDFVLLGWGLTIIPYAAQTAAVGALACFTATGRATGGDAPRQPPAACLVAGLGLALVASFSFGAGFAIWPALLACAFWMRLRGRVYAALALLAPAALLLYLQGLGRYGPRPGRALELGWDLLVYVANLLGSLAYHALAFRDAGLSPSERAPGSAALLAAQAAGFAGLALVALIGARSLRGRSQPRPAQVFADGLLVFGVGAALLIAVGRFGKLPQRFGLLSALESRYVSWSLLFWLGALLHGAAARDEARARHAGREWAVALALVAASVLLLPSHLAGALELRKRQLRVREAGLSLLVGAVDPRARRLLSRHSEYFDPVSAELRRRGQNLFAQPAARLLGSPLADAFALRAGEELQGRALAVRALRGGEGWSAEGWAWDGSRRASPAFVVISDREGTIRGLAGFARRPEESWRLEGLYRQSAVLSLLRRASLRLPKQLGMDLGWFGYVAGVRDPAELSFHAVLADGVTAFALDAVFLGEAAPAG